MKQLCPLLLLVLASCSGGVTPTPGPQPGQWAQNCNAGINGSVVTFPSNPPGACYVYTGLVAKQGQTLTLNYSVAGNGVFAQNPQYNPPDTNPPIIHLLLWRKGDDGQCGPVSKQYRMFAGRTQLNFGDNQTLSVALDPTIWAGCYGDKDTAAQLDDLLNNLFGAGVTFGGQSFDGHGVYVSSGGATFKINSFTAQ